MRLSPRQRLGWLRHLAIACTQQHHRECAPWFEPFVPKDAVVIDVGAHAGQFAKLLAAMAPAGHVYAFEPSAYARSILKPALAVSGRRNVTVIASGLSDAEGEATLSTPIKSAGGMGFGLASLAIGSGRKTAEQTVRLETLDGFVERQGLTRLDFIKADIEGWEAHAIRGGLGAIGRFRPGLFVEVVGESLARAGERPEALWEMLTPLGYEALKAPEMTPVAGYDGPSDYLFRPKAGG